MALVKMEGTWFGGGEGVGAALHGSRPSYVDAASGFSSTKLPPKLEEMPYAWVGRGALNIVVEDQGGEGPETESACAQQPNQVE
jgi:hypothetical protein